MPILDQLANKNPVERFLSWSQLSAPSFATVKFARERVAERLSSPKTLKVGEEPEKPDLLAHLMLSGQKHPNVLTQKMITAQATSIAFAGSDNTAMTITAIIYYLLKNINGYKRLMQELEGAQILGTWYPGGTLVGCNAWILHHRPEIFGDDCASFRRERWMKGSSEALAKMKSCFFAFGAGSRVCIGRAISLLEIGKPLPPLLRNFDLHLQDPARDWTLYNDFLVKQHGVDVRFTRRAAVGTV
ncbi:cytochrome P450 [Elsinoe ampelina]|uniref:Cytochrome P450 n=1 Tax=Elsinoe ampelina TaxID=302913 RepID=A0A6A6GG29_9PEZI|nr:cytochrome P450 [Elsinoe ampelina]